MEHEGGLFVVEGRVVVTLKEMGNVELVAP